MTDFKYKLVFIGGEVMPFFVVQQRMAKKMHQAVPAWIPLYIAPAMLSQGSGGNIVYLNINARRAYTAPVGLYAIKTRDIIYEKQNISLARSLGELWFWIKQKVPKILGVVLRKEIKNSMGEI